MNNTEPNASSSADPLLSEFADDPDMVDLVELFVGEMPGRIQEIDDALATDDLFSLARLAHQLKGAGGGYGFPAITDVARQLEERARAADDLEALRRDIEDLRSLCRRASASPSETG